MFIIERIWRKPEPFLYYFILHYLSAEIEPIIYIYHNKYIYYYWPWSSFISTFISCVDMDIAAHYVWGVRWDPTIDFLTLLFSSERTCKANRIKSIWLLWTVKWSAVDVPGTFGCVTRTLLLYARPQITCQHWSPNR